MSKSDTAATPEPKQTPIQYAHVFFRRPRVLMLLVATTILFMGLGFASGMQYQKSHGHAGRGARGFHGRMFGPSGNNGYYNQMNGTPEPGNVSPLQTQTN